MDHSRAKASEGGPKNSPSISGCLFGLQRITSKSENWIVGIVRIKGKKFSPGEMKSADLPALENAYPNTLSEKFIESIMPSTVLIPIKSGPPAESIGICILES